VISYSHRSKDALFAELKLYDEVGIRYWFDDSMEVSIETYVEQFDNALDHPNCKGAIFFITEPFFLSQPCINELKSFDRKYLGDKNHNRFLLFVVPRDFEFDFASIEGKVKEYGDKATGIQNYSELHEEVRKYILKERIDLFLNLSRGGQLLYGKMHKGDDYIKRECAKGRLFDMAGVISEFVIKEQKEITYGYFPQSTSEERGESFYISFDDIPRPLDKKSVCYSTVDWLVLSEDDASITLLSKLLLYSVDYLDKKHPLNQDKGTVTQYVGDIFREHFKPSKNFDFAEVADVRFISEEELDFLIRYCTDDAQKDVILSPKATFFAQSTANSNAPVFWLAGDVEDARRVDAATGGFSKIRPGTESYYIRPVITLSKR
jgi:hypothetical protein